jgi:hypothetical protein
VGGTTVILTEEMNVNDVELDALLANAKPYELPTGFEGERFAWQRWDDERVQIPDEIFRLLKCDRFDKFNKIYATEQAAMNALRDAVAKYKEARQ